MELECIVNIFNKYFYFLNAFADAGLQHSERALVERLFVERKIQILGEYYGGDVFGEKSKNFETWS